MGARCGRQRKDATRCRTSTQVPKIAWRGCNHVVFEATEPVSDSETRIFVYRPVAANQSTRPAAPGPGPERQRSTGRDHRTGATLLSVVPDGRTPVVSAGVPKHWMQAALDHQSTSPSRARPASSFGSSAVPTSQLITRPPCARCPQALMRIGHTLSGTITYVHHADQRTSRTGRRSSHR